MRTDLCLAAAGTGRRQWSGSWWSSSSKMVPSDDGSCGLSGPWCVCHPFSCFPVGCEFWGQIRITKIKRQNNYFRSNSGVLGQDGVIGADLNHQRPTIASSITLRQTGLAILWRIIQIINFNENILKSKDLVIRLFVPWFTWNTIPLVKHQHSRIITFRLQNYVHSCEISTSVTQ